MIVDPDFLDHWRTQMLFDALGEDHLAPLYVIRIWAHCQSRKGTRFSMPARGLAALCRFKGDADKLESELIAAGFIVRDGADIDVPGWAEHNKKLIANWENGATGGRPNKAQEEPKKNPRRTQEEPTGTHDEPIRIDKTREEKKEEKSKTKASPDGSFFDGIPEQIVSDFKAMRKKQKAEITQTAIDGISREAEKAGISLGDALRICCERSWRGFKAEWLNFNQARGSPPLQIASKLGRAGQATAANAQKWLEEQDAVV